MISAVPSESACNLVNPELWEVFHNVYKSKFGIRPRGFWSEAEVIQFLDIENESVEDKYARYYKDRHDYLSSLEAAADESEYYQQFG